MQCLLMHLLSWLEVTIACGIELQMLVTASGADLQAWALWKQKLCSTWYKDPILCTFEWF